MNAKRVVLAAVAVAPLAWGAPGLAAQQHILLDRPVRAGTLTLFPDLGDSLAYYYLSDKPRLAAGADGAPQFTFLKYVENVRTAGNQPEAREGEGGGIVHALVTLAVGDGELADARRELRRVRPGARIVGPVAYRAGRFGLVSAFRDTTGTLTRRVVGLGNAPLLDGQKAAVSIHLSKLGAKLLWESFQTATPDVSFTFEMDVDGYGSPKRAVIEANWDDVYAHQSFGAGVATTYFAGEIKAAFDDLRRQNVIRVTQIGADEKLEALVTTTYNKLTDAMFRPLQGAGATDLDRLGAAGRGGQSSLADRATGLLNARRAETRRDNEAVRERNAERRRGAGDAAAAGMRVRDLERRVEEAEKRAADIEADATTARLRADDIREQAAALRQGASEERVRQIQSLVEGAERVAAARERLAADARSDVGRLQEELAAARAEVERGSAAGGEDLEETEDLPAFAAIATFEMKQVRQRGTFHLDLNKYTSETRALRFDENIGDLRQLLRDAGRFREANLDDPLYQQREITVFVDGLNARDFGEYINFVSVQLRKRHEGGAETPDEVRIDRANFNREGNAFRMLYGWKGDRERRRWMEYEYRTVWSFFGGGAVEEPWRRTDVGALAVVPPYQIRRVALEANADSLRARQVRSITVSIFYQLAGTERVKQVTINPARGPVSATIEFMLPADQFAYEYEISWRLAGNRAVVSGRRPSSEAILFLDDLPPI